MISKSVRVWLIVMALALLFALPSHAATEIHVGFDNQNWLDQAAEFLEYFAEKYPDIKVNVSTGIGQENMLVMMAGGATPDVYYVRGTWSRGFIEQGFLEPLDPYIKASGFDLSDYNDVMLSAYQNEAGETYALPTDLGLVFAYLNRDHLSQAGLAFPDNDWTWDDALDMAQRLMQTDGDAITRYGWGPGLGSSWQFEAKAVAPWGGRLFNDTETETWVTRPEAINGLTWWENAMALAPLGGDFTTGGASIHFDGSWRITYLNQSVDNIDWDIAPMPMGPVMRATPTQGSAYGISPYSQNKDAAWTFISEFLGPTGQAMIWGVGSAPAARSALPVFLENTLQGKNHAAVFEAFETVFLGRPVMPPGESVFNQGAGGPISAWTQGNISSQELALQLKNVIESMWASR